MRFAVGSFFILVCKLFFYLQTANRILQTVNFAAKIHYYAI
jgi:hypothetical protein